MRAILLLASVTALSGCTGETGSAREDTRETASRDRDDDRGGDDRADSRTDRRADDREGGDDDRTRDDRGRDDRDRDDRDRGDRDEVGDDRDADRAGTADPALVQGLEQGVREYRRTLPRSEGPLTMYEVERDGLELTYRARVEAMNDNQFRAYRRNVAAELCRNATTARLIDMGVTYTYILEPPGGRSFTTSIDRC